MNTVLITGGTGFLGRKLIDVLLARGELPDSTDTSCSIDRLLVMDIRPPNKLLPDDPRIETRFGDFTAPGFIESLVDESVTHVFHLAAAVSGECEKDFDLGMRVNLDGTRRLLEALRGLNPDCVPRLVFTSSVAVYGGEMPDVLDDASAPMPQSSYGAQKAACEQLISDMSRKGFIDGRTLRLPTVVVRAGKANAAASSFASAVVREPLEGRTYTCPVPGDTGVWIMSPRTAVHNLVHGACVPVQLMGQWRTIVLSGLTVTVDDMLDTITRLCGETVAGRVDFDPDPFIVNIISGWPTRFNLSRAARLGFDSDESFDDVVQAFIQDELGGSPIA